MLDMAELNYMGGSFDDCEQYYDELMADDSHTATCLTPWESADLCIGCFASLDDIQESQVHIASSPNKTYAQVAARSPGYDAVQVPTVEAMPTRRPRAPSVSEIARRAMYSQSGAHSAQPIRQRQVWHVSDFLVNSGDSVPASRHQRPTYAEAAQHLNRGVGKYDEGHVTHLLFTSTENSLGLPNQNIGRVSHQPPHRTPRTPISYNAPYPAAKDRHHLHPDIHIPTLIQPEHNQDPRDPYTLVQRTGRGGHREPVLSAMGFGSSSESSPMSCGTPSATSAASRSRRKEVQDRRHPCLVPGCLWKFVNPKDLKRHGKTHAPDATPAYPCPHPFCTKSFHRHDNRNRHIRSQHGDDSGLGASRISSESASVSHSSLSQM